MAPSTELHFPSCFSLRSFQRNSLLGGPSEIAVRLSQTIKIPDEIGSKSRRSNLGRRWLPRKRIQWHFRRLHHSIFFCLLIPCGDSCPSLGPPKKNPEMSVNKPAESVPISSMRLGEARPAAAAGRDCWKVGLLSLAEAALVMALPPLPPPSFLPSFPLGGGCSERRPFSRGPSLARSPAPPVSLSLSLSAAVAL